MSRLFVDIWVYFDGGRDLVTHNQKSYRNFTDKQKEGLRCKVAGNLTFRHRASCTLGQAFHYSPENAFYIFNQRIYFII